MSKNNSPDNYSENHRPQYHFSPEKMWMNDPNGMVYHDGLYHLFYQYHPDSTIWGPMHWGHAISDDLLHWQHKPIALYPDEHGFIFSGSAVVDVKNTSGFGTIANPALVAIFTYHDAKRKAAGHTGFETQGVAYSLDNGESWTKYAGNPVIDIKGSTDFRDPKVFWYEPDQRWIMSLVAGDHAQFYGSENLKHWELLGEFGKEHGAHGGVWECPDLIPFKVVGTEEYKWVLLISINPGAPNGGSGTQYFVGDFDGKTFVTEQTENLWIDWGTDNYAGVTFSNVPKEEQVFLGWMSNWLYANETPQQNWRGAMTTPRKLTLEKIGDGYFLFNYPIKKLDDLISITAKKDLSIAAKAEKSIISECLMQSEIYYMTSARAFELRCSNDYEDALILTLDSEEQQFTLNRAHSGKVDFHKDFSNSDLKMPVHGLPNGIYEVRILIDRSSIEIFLNKGQYAMTAQIFPNGDYNRLKILNTSDRIMELTNFTISSVAKVW